MFVTYTWPATFRSVPIDHGYLLYSAISKVAQHVHEGSWQLCLMTGHAHGRELRGPGAVRLRGPLAPAMLGTLNDARLRIGCSREVALGQAVIAEVKPARDLAARFVTIKNAITPDAMASHLCERLHTLIEHIPEFEIGRRRVAVIGGKKIVGFGVTIRGLDDDESLAVQAEGIGGRRRMGGGIFEAVEPVRGRWFVTPYAVRRLLERHGRALGLSEFDDARAWVIEDSAFATKAHDARGGEVWVGRRPWRIRYVIGTPTISSPSALPPVVTVLPNERRSDSC